MTQTFRVSHADLYRQPARGVTVAVPVGTRQVRLVPSVAAVPVELHTDMMPADARVQDGRLFHSAGETLYPGDSLLLPDGCTSLQVRLPPTFNAGAEQYIAASTRPVPFGEDARRSMLYGGSALAAADFVDGPWPTTDGLSLGIADAQLTFVCSRELQLHSGTGLATLPHTVTLPALYNDPVQGDCAAPNLPERVSVQNNLTCTTPGTGIIVQVVAPWHIASQGALARFQRVRLRVGVGATYKPGETTVGSAYFSPYSFGGPTPVNQVLRAGFPLGAYAVAAPFPLRQFMLANSSSVTIDLGTPQELFSVAAGSDDRYLAQLVVADPSVAWTTQPACWGQWIFDNAPSSPGRVESWGRVMLSHHDGGFFVQSPRGNTTVRAVVSNLGTGGAISAWRCDETATVDTTTTPVYSVPVTDLGAQTAFGLPVGTWYVATTGTLVATIEASEG